MLVGLEFPRKEGVHVELIDDAVLAHVTLEQGFYLFVLNSYGREDCVVFADRNEIFQCHVGIVSAYL